jgi:hypothetical protein
MQGTGRNFAAIALRHFALTIFAQREESDDKITREVVAGVLHVPAYDVMF